MLNIYAIILVILLIALYIAAGIFGAIMFSKFWRGWHEEISYEERDYDSSDEDFKLFKPGDTQWLKICQCLCVVFGPVVPCLIISALVLVEVVYLVISVVTWIKEVVSKK